MGARRTYAPRVTPEGGSELDPRQIFDLLAGALDRVLRRASTLQISAVASSSLATNILGIDHAGGPVTPAYLYSDSRSAPQVKRLGLQYDWASLYARTGCPPHTSYLPGRFAWLRETQTHLFDQSVRWLSLHEYILLRLFGETRLSHSFASWSGMFDHARLDWDTEALAIAGVSRAQLTPPSPFSRSVRGLTPEFAARWAALADVPFFPALGDGAAANIGSGCAGPTQMAVTVGTSGAMRVVVSAVGLSDIPPGLWFYRVDETRGLLGGALNDGGNIFAYLRELLRLPDPATLDDEVLRCAPDSHGLTLLPFFSGERSPGYRGEARAALTGWRLDTSAVALWRAAMEAVAYRFALIYNLLGRAVPAPRAIVASGAALLNSRAWAQILADVLGEPITLSAEPEASARGAVLMALEALGVIPHAGALPAPPSITLDPNPAHHMIYRQALERQEKLYRILIEN